jgi:hypothetical protein
MVLQESLWRGKYISAVVTATLENLIVAYRSKNTKFHSVFFYNVPFITAVPVMIHGNTG